MGRNDLKKLLDEKKRVKDKIFLKFWRKKTLKNPLLVIFAGQDEVSRSILDQLLQGLHVLPFQVAVIAGFESSSIAKNDDQTVWLNSETCSQTQLDNWLTASDMALVFEENQELFKKVFSHGAVPVGYEKVSVLKNYHPNEETGNSFTFGLKNPWDIFSALTRANETYRFPYDWQNIIRGFLEVR